MLRGEIFVSQTMSATALQFCAYQRLNTLTQHNHSIHVDSKQDQITVSQKALTEHPGLTCVQDSSNSHYMNMNE